MDKLALENFKKEILEEWRKVTKNRSIPDSPQYPDIEATLQSLCEQLDMAQLLPTEDTPPLENLLVQLLILVFFSAKVPHLTVILSTEGCSASSTPPHFPGQEIAGPETEEETVFARRVKATVTHPGLWESHVYE